LLASANGRRRVFIAFVFLVSLRWTLLTESEVQRTFNKLFRDSDISQEKLEKGEQLLELLRPESPLRFRLEEQLEELRRLCVS
jgi:hypothetical protein